MFVGASHVPKQGKSAREIVDGVPFRVTVDGRESTVYERDGTVTVPLELDGETLVVVKPINHQ